MVILGMLLASLFISAAEMLQRKTSFEAIQIKLEHRNLFDTCIDNKKFFCDMNDKNDATDVYINYLNAGSNLLKLSFAAFIKRKSLSLSDFRNLKRLAYAHSLTSSPDNSVISKLDENFLVFKNELKWALIDEREEMMTQLEEFSAICKIFHCSIANMRIHLYRKDQKDNNISKNLGKALNRFCKYAYLMNSCYLQINK